MMRPARLDLPRRAAYSVNVAICYRIAGHVKHSAKMGLRFYDLDTFAGVEVF
jgi:hypothetical protein